jgi:hypothetical protein
MLHENGRVIGVLRKCHYPPHGDFERIVQVHGDLKAFASVFKESSWVELIVSVIINFDASTPTRMNYLIQMQGGLGVGAFWGKRKEEAPGG